MACVAPAPENSFNRLVSDTLDCLGWNPALVKHRQVTWLHYASTLESLTDGRFSGIYAGSKGEGVTAVWESDWDVMLVQRDVVCSEGPTTRAIERDTNIFQVDRESTSPGYTRLRLDRLPFRTGAPCDRILLNSLVRTDEGPRYISSDIYFAYMTVNRQLPGSLPRQGPSAPSKFMGVPQDVVYAFRCNCPNLLSAWVSRHRSNDWPPQQTIQKISTLEAHVVPVGFSLSHETHLEWRICFTLAEIALIHTFNDTQIKVYVLLKAIAKSLFKPVCGAMTSYVMKNLMLWASEQTPTHLFRTELLIDRLMHCLRILKKFIQQRHLPNYMIPDRNMMLGKVDASQGRRLLAVLEQAIDDGGSVLLRCDSVRVGLVKMFTTPEVIRQEGKDREAQERARMFQLGTTCRRLLNPRVVQPTVIHPRSVTQGPAFAGRGMKTGGTDDEQPGQVRTDEQPGQVQTDVQPGHVQTGEQPGQVQTDEQPGQVQTDEQPGQVQTDKQPAYLGDPVVQQLWRLGKLAGNQQLAEKKNQ